MLGEWSRSGRSTTPSILSSTRASASPGPSAISHGRLTVRSCSQTVLQSNGLPVKPSLAILGRQSLSGFLNAASFLFLCAARLCCRRWPRLHGPRLHVGFWKVRNAFLPSHTPCDTCWRPFCPVAPSERHQSINEAINHGLRNPDRDIRSSALLLAFVFAEILLSALASTVGEIAGHSKKILSCDFKQTRPFQILTASEDFQVCLVTMASCEQCHAQSRRVSLHQSGSLHLTPQAGYTGQRLQRAAIQIRAVLQGAPEIRQLRPVSLRSLSEWWCLVANSCPSTRGCTDT